MIWYVNVTCIIRETGLYRLKGDSYQNFEGPLDNILVPSSTYASNLICLRWVACFYYLLYKSMRLWSFNFNLIIRFISSVGLNVIVLSGTCLWDYFCTSALWCFAEWFADAPAGNSPRRGLRVTEILSEPETLANAFHSLLIWWRCGATRRFFDATFSTQYFSIMCHELSHASRRRRRNIEYTFTRCIGNEREPQRVYEFRKLYGGFMKDLFVVPSP